MNLILLLLSFFWQTRKLQWGQVSSVASCHHSLGNREINGSKREVVSCLGQYFPTIPNQNFMRIFVGFCSEHQLCVGSPLCVSVRYQRVYACACVCLCVCVMCTRVLVCVCVWWPQASYPQKTLKRSK